LQQFTRHYNVFQNLYFIMLRAKRLEKFEKLSWSTIFMSEVHLKIKSIF